MHAHVIIVDIVFVPMDSVKQIFSIKRIDVNWGGVATQKKPNATANFKFGTGFFRFFSVFFGFFWFFSVFFGFSILANFDWFNGFLLSGSFC